MRFSTVMAVLLIGAVLYVVMAVIRAVANRRKAVRGAVFGAVVLLGALLANWW